MEEVVLNQQEFSFENKGSIPKILKIYDKNNKVLNMTQNGTILVDGNQEVYKLKIETTGNKILLFFIYLFSCLGGVNGDEIWDIIYINDIVVNSSEHQKIKIIVHSYKKIEIVGLDNYTMKKSVTKKDFNIFLGMFIIPLLLILLYVFLYNRNWSY